MTTPPRDVRTACYDAWRIKRARMVAALRQAETMSIPPHVRAGLQSDIEMLRLILEGKTQQ